MIIAHRGASAEQPENTLAAFQRAIEVGAHCLELDVHLSRDGIPICRHDALVGPNCTLLADLSVKEIKALPGMNVVPTLEQVLNLDRRDVQLFIELKGLGCRSPKRLVEAVVDLVHHFEGFGHSRPFLGSFSIWILREIAARWPQDHIIGLAEYESELDPLHEVGIGVLGLENKLATPKRLAEAHQPIWVWTVDDTARAVQLLQQGASGIITNNPLALSTKTGKGS